MSDLPPGCGIYVRNIRKQIHGTPAQMAKRAADNNLGWVAIQCAWQTTKITKRSNLKHLPAYAEALRAKGVEPWAWCYPDPRAGLDPLLDRIQAVLPHVDGIVLDPEVGYKPRKRIALESLVDGTIDLLSEATGLGVTSYGLKSAHKTFPWSAIEGVGFGSPQVYTVPPRTAVRACNQWLEDWANVYPSVPTFGPKAEGGLDAYLSAMPEVDGFIFWSWLSTSRIEWRTIAKWSERFSNGQDALV